MGSNVLGVWVSALLALSTCVKSAQAVVAHGTGSLAAGPTVRSLSNRLRWRVLDAASRLIFALIRSRIGTFSCP
ncbi:hypothetical protein B0H13DRAFT_2173746, partial [Mycena leptocephala]